MTELSPEHVRPETWAVSAGRPPAEPNQPLNQPPMLASAFGAGGDLEYARYANPSWEAFEETLGGLEGGRALAFASGMAAAAAVIDLVPHGGIIVVAQHSYLGTLALLDQLSAQGRISVRRVDAADTAAFEAALPGAALAWFESPTNPALELVDLAHLLPVANRLGVRSVVDNTFATPVFQRPLELGADIVMHSATKYIAGHSDVVLGALVTKDEALLAELGTQRKLRGAIPGPFEVFLALRGLRTMPLRVERSSANAAELARRFTDHGKLAEVRYPGFGSIVALVLPDAASADTMIARCQLWRHATSLGGVESTLERRRRHPGEASTIPEGLIRLSVGIEHVDDLYRDLDQALG